MKRITAFAILALTLTAGVVNADAAPVESYTCEDVRVSYDGKALTVNDWRFVNAVTFTFAPDAAADIARQIGRANTNHQVVLLLTLKDGRTLFMGDYFDPRECAKN